MPPPPTLKRNGSMRSLRLLQQLQQQQLLPGNGSSSSNNKAMGAMAQLCSSDLLEDCTKTVLDDCAASLLKCTNSGGGSLSGKPDLCQATGNGNSHAHAHAHKHAHGTLDKPHKHKQSPPFAAHEEDNIFTPHSQKSDPSLCFVPATAAPAAAAAATVAAVPSKYNTIGPSSDYARHLAHYSRYLQKQHQQQQLAHFQQQRCRCFSQSLLNFPNNQQQQQQQQADLKKPNGVLQELAQPARIFHTSSVDWTLPANSRSFSNLVDIDGACRLPYQKMQPTSLLASSGFTMNSFDSGNSSGLLKERESQAMPQSQQQQPHLHSHSQSAQPHAHSHPHAHPHAHTHPHPHPHHYHAHDVAHTLLHHGGAGGALPSTPQKHHQLHSSVTSIMPWKHRQCPSRGSSSSGTNSFRKCAQGLHNASYLSDIDLVIHTHIYMAYIWHISGIYLHDSN